MFMANMSSHFGLLFGNTKTFKLNNYVTTWSSRSQKNWAHLEHQLHLHAKFELNPSSHFNPTAFKGYVGIF